MDVEPGGEQVTNQEQDRDHVTNQEASGGHAMVTPGKSADDNSVNVPGGLFEALAALLDSTTEPERQDNATETATTATAAVAVEAATTGTVAAAIKDESVNSNTADTALAVYTLYSLEEAAGPQQITRSTWELTQGGHIAP